MLKYALALAVVFLVMSPLDWPYGYYQILRIVVTGALIWLGIEIKAAAKPIELVFLVIIAISYNPIIKVSMERELHAVVNFVTVAFIAIIAFRHWDKLKNA